ncbi:hypothetical protein SAMN05216563_10869 [Phytobacter palmae]|nr:hypothetical protein SAMN05216563_10869 [Phytobacter palmae]
MGTLEIFWVDGFDRLSEVLSSLLQPVLEMNIHFLTRSFMLLYTIKTFLLFWFRIVLGSNGK